MLKFESWPPEPATTFITEDTVRIIAASSLEDNATRVATTYHISRGIADILHNNADGGRGMLSTDRAQAFFEAIAPQVPETPDDNVVGIGIATRLHAILLGTGA